MKHIHYTQNLYLNFMQIYLQHLLEHRSHCRVFSLLLLLLQLLFQINLFCRQIVFKVCFTCTLYTEESITWITPAIEIQEDVYPYINIQSQRRFVCCFFLTIFNRILELTFLNIILQGIQKYFIVFSDQFQSGVYITNNTYKLHKCTKPCRIKQFEIYYQIFGYSSILYTLFYTFKRYLHLKYTCAVYTRKNIAFKCKIFCGFSNIFIHTSGSISLHVIIQQILIDTMWHDFLIHILKTYKPPEIQTKTGFFSPYYVSCMPKFKKQKFY